MPYAKEIIESQTSEIIHRKNITVKSIKRHNTTILVKSHADFWSLTKMYDETTITVVIRQIGTKGKHFFSIYDAKSPKNQKTAMDMTVA